MLERVPWLRPDKVEVEVQRDLFELSERLPTRSDVTLRERQAARAGR